LKRLYKLFVTFAFAALSTHAAEVVSHKIKSGETLFAIAHAYHSSIKDVRELNGLKSGEVLKPGKTLKVPVNSYFPEKGLRAHTVKSGETLSGIAHKYHTRVALLKKLNGIEKGKRLRVGEVIKVPKDTYFASKEKSVTQKTAVAVKKKQSKARMAKRTVVKNYTIRKGDTLYTIAKKHKMTVAELVKINKIAYKATLKPGVKLKVAKTVTVKKKKTRVAKQSSKSKRSKHLLKTALKKQSKPLASKRVRHARSSEDIFFKSMQPRLKHFGTKLDRRKAYRITSLAKKKLGRRYAWGAAGNNAFDCSGLTTYVYRKNGIRLPRRAIAQSKVGKRIPRSQLKPGDLVFFDTSKHHRGYVNHVGIYIGNGKFIHASSAKKKVVITSLNKPFYAKRFKVARRLASSS